MRLRAARSVFLVTLASLAPSPALAHVGRPPAPHDLWTSWNAAPQIILLLVVMTAIYARGTRAAWRRAGRGRAIARWRVWCYAAGVLAVAVALLSPVDAVGEALFAAHMIQHLLLVAVAAPLIALGLPGRAALWALPHEPRQRFARGWRASPTLRAGWRVLTHPVSALTLHTIAMWGWHLPRLYEAALRSPWVHALEHTSFFLTALVFWYVLADRGSRRRMGFGGAVLYLFLAALQSTILGAVLTFAQHPLYTSHLATTGPWGLTPLEDQQLAGLIMWVPAGFVYLAALVPILAQQLRADNAPRPLVPAMGLEPAK